MLWLESIAEHKIREAIERGELADLPGEGRPLDLGDDLLVPEEWRVGYRMLKNAGVLPPELRARSARASDEFQCGCLSVLAAVVSQDHRNHLRVDFVPTVRHANTRHDNCRRD